jgi:hypothetical protein
MPNLFLDKIEKADGTVSDPAADIAAYLLSDASKSDWTPEAAASAEVVKADLDNLVLQNLKEVFFDDQAIDYLGKGIPASMASELKGAEIEMVEREDADLTQQKLRYIGKKTTPGTAAMAVRHPGFEDAADRHGRPLVVRIPPAGRLSTLRTI